MRATISSDQIILKCHTNQCKGELIIKGRRKKNVANGYVSTLKALYYIDIVPRLKH